MIDIQVVVIIVVLGTVLLGSAAYGLWTLKVNVLNPEGKGCEKKTASLLKMFALPRRFRTFSNVRFSHKGSEYQIENLLIGYFGILIVTTLGKRGAYYGQLDGKTWQFESDKFREVFPNPAAAQDDAMAALRGVFSQNKVYSVPMEGVLVLTNTSKKTQLHVTNDGRIFLPGKLRPYLNKTKFEKDAGVDVEKVAAIIAEISKSK